MTRGEIITKWAADNGIGLHTSDITSLVDMLEENGYTKNAAQAKGSTATEKLGEELGTHNRLQAAIAAYADLLNKRWLVTGDAIVFDVSKRLRQLSAM